MRMKSDLSPEYRQRLVAAESRAAASTLPVLSGWLAVLFLALTALHPFFLPRALVLMMPRAVVGPRSIGEPCRLAFG